jgi:hypothetical protein
MRMVNANHYLAMMKMTTTTRLFFPGMISRTHERAQDPVTKISVFPKMSRNP